MTATQTQILELFRALSAEEQEALLPQLAEEMDAFSEDDLSPEEIAAIEEGIAQADRGEVVDGEVVMARIAALYGFPRA